MSKEKDNKPDLKIVQDVEEENASYKPGEEESAGNTPEPDMSEEETEKLREQYMNEPITRQEATEMAQVVAQRAIDEFADFLRQPLQTNLVQTMAVIEIMKDRELLDGDEELEKYITAVFEKLEAGDPNAKEEESDTKETD